MSEIEEHDVGAWVEGASTKSDQEFREAVHTILLAIASSHDLKANMVLKGGILLAIRYKSHRYTKDIDFSTDKKLGNDITVNKIRASLSSSLLEVVEELDYDLDCRVQSSKLKPKDPKSTYPSIQIKVGYAYKGSSKHKRLLALQSPSTVSIDYSLNESIPNVENLNLDVGGVLIYSLTDLIAEKYRSLLQQVPRNRERRQDIYDLNLLIEELGDIDSIEKGKILSALVEKSEAREIDPDANSFNDPKLRYRAQKNYLTLEDEIKGELPEFDGLFRKVASFYRYLPWP